MGFNTRIKDSALNAHSNHVYYIVTNYLLLDLISMDNVKYNEQLKAF